MLQDAETDFIEGMGLIIQGDGMPRIAGRLMGLFVLRGGPFSFTELAETLEISRGSVSTNTRLLEDLGVIERVAIRGERQDFFRLAADPYARIIERKHARSLRAQDTIHRNATHLTKAGPEALERIRDLGNFFHVLTNATAHALEEIEAKDGNERSARATPIPSNVAAE